LLKKHWELKIRQTFSKTATTLSKAPQTPDTG